MKTLIQRAAASPFLRHNATAFVGSVTVATLSYLYYPVLGRLLRPADFGEVQAINSIYLQSVVFMSVFSIVIVSVITKYRERDTQARLIAELEKVAFVIALWVMLMLFVLSPWIASFFRFGAVYPFLLLLFALLLSVPATFRTAYLQGVRDFAAVYTAGGIGAAAKIVFSAVLVVAGWAAFGAVLGMVLSQVCALLFVIGAARRRGWLWPANFRAASLPDLRAVTPELKFAAFVFITTLSFNIFLSLDILAVKHWFAPSIAGLYAGIETLSRIVFFINISVAGVLLPSVSPLQTPCRNRTLLLRSAALTAGLGAVVLLAFVAAPQLIVTVLMGRKFLPFANLLPWLGTFTFLASLVNLLIAYYLAQRKLFIAPALALGLLATLVILVARHNTLYQVVAGLIAGALCTLGIIGLLRLLAGRFRPNHSPA